MIYIASLSICLLFGSFFTFCAAYRYKRITIEVRLRTYTDYEDDSEKIDISDKNSKNS